MMTVTTQSVLEYINMMDNVDTQTFLDELGQEGIYMIYRSGVYAELPIDMLHGVYYVLLTNIKLNECNDKTGILEYSNLVNHRGEIVYTCRITTDEDILTYGKDKWYDFLACFTKRKALDHKECQFKGTKPNEYNYPIGIEINEDVSEDMISYILTNRYHINRRKGHEGVRLMIRTYVEELLEFYRQDERLGTDVYNLTGRFLNELDVGKPWLKMGVRNNSLYHERNGLTYGDRKEIEELKGIVIKEYNKN